MIKKTPTLLFLVSVCLIFQTFPLTVKVIPAPDMNTHQWQDVNSLWGASFYDAYKDLPFNQVDEDIKDASKEELESFLQRLFDKYYLTALENSYSLVLIYEDKQLLGYTLYHMINGQTLLHIDQFAVSTECQGKGIGKKLLEATIESQPQALSVVLTTRILNLNAQRFYARQGFYQLTNLDNFVFNPQYSILLRKDIKAC